MHPHALSPAPRLAAALALATAGVLGGCYEQHPPSPAPAAEPAPAAPQPSGPATGAVSQPGSALGGAQRAARNTVESLDERQQELDKALKDNQ